MANANKRKVLARRMREERVASAKAEATIDKTPIKERAALEPKSSKSAEH